MIDRTGIFYSEWTGHGDTLAENYQNDKKVDLTLRGPLGAKTLAQPAPVWVIGSYDAQGKPNIMTIAWGGPPCVTVSLRKATYTYECIKERKAYTVNIPLAAHVKETDYVGTVSGRTVDKFASTKLTPVRSELVDKGRITQSLSLTPYRL